MRKSALVLEHIRGLVAIGAALLLASPALAGSGHAVPQVHISTGGLAGVRDRGVDTFLGIPYAAPPIGPMRWAPPKPAADWKDVRQADHFGPSCPQVLNPAQGRPPWTPEYLIPGPISEDCLTLNVWRPAARPGKAVRARPVLFWIHGGAFVEGSGSVPVYNGAALARRGVILVTINYRLGILGFLAHPELSAEQGGESGNYAMLDVLAALHWVKANIAAFGGDPQRVTIAGQSAGGGAVNALIASPLAKGLFSRAIVESALVQSWGGRQAADLAASESRGSDFAASIGAPDLAALRALPADRLVANYAAWAHANGGLGMATHTALLPRDAFHAQGIAGAFNDTPVMAGFVREERSGMDDHYGAWSAEELAAQRDRQFAPFKDRAAALFPVSDAASGKRLWTDITRLSLYVWAHRRAAASRQPIYAYLFSHPEPGPTQARYGTFHSSEIPYVFGNLDAPRPFGAADRAVSRAVQSRWIRFVEGHSPTAPGQPVWSDTQPQIMLLGDREQAEPVAPKAARELINAIVAGNEQAVR